MKKSAALLAVLMLLTLFSACSQKEESDIPEGYLKATNDAVDFSFLYPEDWTLDRNDGLIKVIAPSAAATATTTAAPETNSSISINDISNITAATIGVTSDFGSIEDYYDYYADEFEKSFAGYEEIGERDADETTGALTVCYKGSVAGIEYKYLQKMFYARGYVYTFTYTAPIDYYDSHLEAAEAVFDSITFKN